MFVFRLTKFILQPVAILILAVIRMGGWYYRILPLSIISNTSNISDARTSRARHERHVSQPDLYYYFKHVSFSRYITRYIVWGLSKSSSNITARLSLWHRNLAAFLGFEISSRDPILSFAIRQPPVPHGFSWLLTRTEISDRQIWTDSLFSFSHKWPLVTGGGPLLIGTATAGLGTVRLLSL